MHPFCIKAVDGAIRGDGRPWPVWSWNHDYQKPSFEPSLLCNHSYHICQDRHFWTECPPDCPELGHAVLWASNGELRPKIAGEEVPEDAIETTGHSSPHPLSEPWGDCHSFLRNGVWQFLPDSAHPLSGQNVSMEPIPDWWLG